MFVKNSQKKKNVEENLTKKQHQVKLKTKYKIQIMLQQHYLIFFAAAVAAASFSAMIVVVIAAFNFQRNKTN